MSGNRIVRSAYDSARTITDRTVSGALLPGTAVFVGQYTLTQANAASGGRLALLADRDYYGMASFAFTTIDSLRIPYTSGDSAVAYLIEPADECQWAMAAGTYSAGQELTVAASGRLAAVVSGNIVVAHYDQAGSTVADGYLADVCIANFYKKA